MRFYAWWSGFLAACALERAADGSWGWVLFDAAFAALCLWWAHREARKARTVPLDQPTAAIAAGLLHIRPDEVADIEVTTRSGEHARFSVWRNQ